MPRDGVHQQEMVHTMARETGKSAGGGRRQHDGEFKRRLVDLSLQSGASVAAIALEHGINASLLFKWKRDRLRREASSASAVLVPVQLKREMLPAAVVAAAAKPAVEQPGAAAASCIEVEVAGALLRLHGDVGEANLRVVLRALRQRA